MELKEPALDNPRPASLDPQKLPAAKTTILSVFAAICVGLTVLATMVPRAILNGDFTSANVLVYTLNADWEPWKEVPSAELKPQNGIRFPRHERRLAGLRCSLDTWTIYNPRQLAQEIEERNKNPRPGAQATSWRGVALECGSTADTGGLFLSGTQNCNSMNELMTLCGFADEYSLIGSMLGSSRCREMLNLQVRLENSSPKYSLDCSGSSELLAKSVESPLTLPQYQSWRDAAEASEAYHLPVLIRIDDINSADWFNQADPVKNMFASYGKSHGIAAVLLGVGAFLGIWIARWRGSATRIANWVSSAAAKLDKSLVASPSDKKSADGD